ncbi:hypothetical protein PDL71_15595 [Lacibacter sp. MH-610]|uniref:LPD29 domain-containing protein n=1 Tax=Lacibacter sp. MH-610 TaxID=3020883 RepID=UPI00389221B9
MRLLTKSDREQGRQIQFDSLIKQGYQKTEYKNLIVFSHPADLLLKTFWGTAANHTDFFRYKTPEQLAAKIEALKETADRRETRKAEQKEKNKGYKSSHAAASAAIKQELKKYFPCIKFSVTSDSFAGGNSVDISWTDGPTTKQVEAITSKYQYGHFDGMNDIYENSNHRDDIPQAKYVQEHRRISDELENEVKAQLIHLKKYKDDELNDYRRSPEAEARQLLYNTNVPHNYTGLTVAINDDNNSRDFFKITFETPQEEQPTTEQPTAAPAGKIQIVDYSEKSFAVIGEFSAHYDNLIELGGSYNKFLKCGRGIIFSKKRLEAVKSYFIANKQTEEQAPETPAVEQEQESPKAAPVNESDILPVPENNTLNLESLKILWHEGRMIEGAIFNETTFYTWQDVQKAFFILWQTNERGQNGGYTKVKCEIKLQGHETEICRVDITDRVNNGDFNPSIQHITDYISELIGETEPEQNTAMQMLLN